MNRPHISLFIFGSSLAVFVSQFEEAQAQSTIDISTETIPSAPRLHPPFVVGTVTEAEVLFAVPATGAQPLAFAAEELPAGLTLEPDTGVITGTAPVAGDHPFEVTVLNGEGSASAVYTLRSGGGLALTPPMGWNSYDSFGASVTEQEMLDEASAVRQLLQPFGWNTVVIDYRWYEPGQPIDANGRYLPARSKYPSATGDTGFTSLAEGIHAAGLKFGIHIMRGVPRVAYDANLPIANSSYTTRDAGNPNDACPWDNHMWGVRGDTEAGQAWYDALFAQYAAWGVDFVKIDDMLNNTTREFHQAESEAIRRAVDKTGRSMVISFSPGPDEPSWLPRSASTLNQTANMWRVVNDFWDYNALTDLNGVFVEASTWQGVEGLTPGHWPDLDMLPLGYLGPRCEWHASGQTTFSQNEQVTILSLWTMLPSPLMFGGNPAYLDQDPWTRALLTNEEILSVHQDPLGARGRREVVEEGEIWMRELSDGRQAVGFFNRGGSDATMAISLSELGLSETPRVRDLWRRADVVQDGEELVADVPGGAALVFTVEAANLGVGGAGEGGAGGAGNGGSDGLGGLSGEGGTEAAGGVSEPGVGGSASGGSDGSGGALGVGGDASEGGVPGEGGAAGVGNVGGLPGAGGALGTGGASTAGGAPGAGGLIAVGGAEHLGGGPGAGGGLGMGGAFALGGAPSGGGALTTAGMPGVGGASLDGAGGTSVANAGNAGDPPTSATMEGSENDPQGCGCRLVGDGPAPRSSVMAWAAVLLALLPWRRSWRREHRRSASLSGNRSES